MFDISDNNSKDYVISYFINANDESLNKIFATAEKALSSVLNEGITEKDFEENTLPKIIRRNVDVNTTNNQITVITALLEQVIVPNMIVDESATELARKAARESVSPIKVKFSKGDTIVKVGEPITQVKKEALSKAGYNILNINYLGVLGIFAQMGGQCHTFLTGHGIQDGHTVRLAIVHVLPCHYVVITYLLNISPCLTVHHPYQWVEPVQSIGTQQNKLVP